MAGGTRRKLAVRTYLGGAERDWLRDMTARAFALFGSDIPEPARLLALSRVIRASIRVAMRHPDEVLEEIRADAANDEEGDE
jgi:hypothetical protein